VLGWLQRVWHVRLPGAGIRTTPGVRIQDCNRPLIGRATLTTHLGARHVRQRIWLVVAVPVRKCLLPPPLPLPLSSTCCFSMLDMGNKPRQQESHRSHMSPEGSVLIGAPKASGRWLPRSSLEYAMRYSQGVVLSCGESCLGHQLPRVEV
jgi:hypothetical protein